jgi:hypothetical protein
MSDGQCGNEDGDDSDSQVKLTSNFDSSLVKHRAPRLGLDVEAARAEEVEDSRDVEPKRLTVTEGDAQDVTAVPDRLRVSSDKRPTPYKPRNPAFFLLEPEVSPVVNALRH